MKSKRLDHGWHALSNAKGVVIRISHAHHIVLGRATLFVQKLREY